LKIVVFGYVEGTRNAYTAIPTFYAFVLFVVKLFCHATKGPSCL